jgi:hypothetical protein
MNTDMRDKLWESFPDLIFFDGPVNDTSIVGLAMIEDDGYHIVTVYDKEMVLRDLVNSSAAESIEEAELDAIEWFDFNIIGAYVGTFTPLFICEDLDEDCAAMRFSESYSDYFSLKDVNTLLECYDLINPTNKFLFVPLNDANNLAEFIKI